MEMMQIVERYPRILAGFLDLSGTTLVLTADEEYRITSCNESLSRKLYLPEKPVGSHLGSVLCPLEDAELSLILSDALHKMVPQLFRLCNSQDLYRCYAFPVERGYLVLGDKMGSTENEVLESMSHLNNELSAMSRELSKKNRELERANARITQLARTDSLTGLANRSYFLERFRETLALTSRHGLELAIVVADLDHFKRINDTYGHDAGDRVLQTFGSILARNCRTEDLAARYGGEELVIMLPETSAAGAEAMFDRVRGELIHCDILPESDYVTFSAGIAEYAEGDTETSLLKRADDALYRAKDAGRDRCSL